VLLYKRLSDIIRFNVSAHLRKCGTTGFYFPGGQGVRLLEENCFVCFCL